MKVFGCTRDGCYSGGIILVAANSIEEALEVYRNDSDYDWQWYEYDEGEIHYSYYEPKRWREYPQLSYNGDKPCVILEEGYTEETRNAAIQSMSGGTVLTNPHGQAIQQCWCKDS